MMKPNLGWFSLIVANHGIAMDPLLHMVLLDEKPTTPPGKDGPVRPQQVGLPMSYRLPLRPSTVFDCAAKLAERAARTAKVEICFCIVDLLLGTPAIKLVGLC